MTRLVHGSILIVALLAVFHGVSALTILIPTLTVVSRQNRVHIRDALGPFLAS